MSLLDRLELPPRAVPLLVASIAGFALVAQIVGFHDLRFDDAYITFRYGQNLASGRGFVFNPGERLLGTTSPLHAMLSAAFYALVGRERLPDVMASIGCVGWTAQAVLVFVLLERRVSRGVAAFAAVAVAAGAADPAPWVALETNVLAALELGAIVAAFRSRWHLAALLVGLAVLERPDACLLAIPLAVWCARETGRRAIASAAIATAVVAPWVVFATAYFGSPIPQTLAAKLHASSIAAYAPYALRTLVEGLAFGAGWPIVLVLFALAAHGGFVLVSRDRRFLALLAFAALHVAAYVLVLRSGVMFPWHLYPATLVVVVLALVGAATIVARAPWPAAIALGAVACASFAVRTTRFALAQPDAHWFGSRDFVYRKVAENLRALSRPTDLVDAEEVGTLAYWSDLPMTDHPGLVSAHNTERGHRFFFEGKPTHLRWLVMNSTTLPGHSPLLRGVPVAEVAHGEWRLWIADMGAVRPRGA